MLLGIETFDELRMAWEIVFLQRKAAITTKEGNKDLSLYPISVEHSMHSPHAEPTQRYP